MAHCSYCRREHEPEHECARMALVKARESQNLAHYSNGLVDKKDGRVGVSFCTGWSREEIEDELRHLRSPEHRATFHNAIGPNYTGWHIQRLLDELELIG